MSTTRHVATLALVTLGMLGVTTSAHARDHDVSARGTCTRASTAKLEVDRDHGRLEIEFEVDQNRNGVRWQVVMRRNGVRFFRGTQTTRAPGGWFEVERTIVDRPGPDTIWARATSPGGEICRATVTVRRGDHDDD